MTRETEEGLKLDEKAPVPEKQGALEDAPQAEENKDNKDTNEEEEKEEDKVYFFVGVVLFIVHFGSKIAMSMVLGCPFQPHNKCHLLTSCSCFKIMDKRLLLCC